MSDSSPNQLRPTEYRDSAEPSGTQPRRLSQSAPGEIIQARYRLLRKLGEGGMGVVWVAHSLALGVDVAIKLIRSDRVDPDLASRMAREAQATARLGHPAIVRVYDHGTTASGEPYLVMELVEGETLAALLSREGKLGPVEAIQLLLPVIDGLRCAHERGIIHRDIKPENVLVARDPLGRSQPKLLDFGIAKLEQQPNVSRLTQVGDVLGSPEFMSPEQARGVPDIDARTDVWALCVMLYEMLTGSVPFKNKNYNALMQAILHERPVPTMNLGAGDSELWTVIAKGLEKSREKRWSSMTKLGEALAFWLYDHGVTEDVCGNSLRAVWLGGTLVGVSRPRVDSWTDAVVSTPPGEERGSPTVRLRLRRLRHRVWRAMTPPVKVGVAIAGVLLLTLLLVSWSRRDDPNAAERALAAGAVSVLPPVATASAPPAPVSAPEIVPVPLDALPKASASARPKRSIAPPRPVVKKKPVRDYGL
jgi:eukaryotic-like serine/threonine-protein kinase